MLSEKSPSFHPCPGQLPLSMASPRGDAEYILVLFSKDVVRSVPSTRHWLREKANVQKWKTTIPVRKDRRPAQPHPSAGMYSCKGQQELHTAASGILWSGFFPGTQGFSLHYSNSLSLAVIHRLCGSLGPCRRCREWGLAGPWSLRDRFCYLHLCTRRGFTAHAEQEQRAEHCQDPAAVSRRTSFLWVLPRSQRGENHWSPVHGSLSQGTVGEISFLSERPLKDPCTACFI